MPNRTTINSKNYTDGQCRKNLTIIIIIHSRCASLLYYKHEGDALPDPLDYYKEINIAQVCIIN